MCAPLSTTTWLHSVAAADAARTRAASSPLRSPSSSGSWPLPARSRANSPACGVSTQGRVTLVHHSSADASVRSASASRTAGGPAALLGRRQDEAQEVGRGQRRPQPGPDHQGVVLVVEDLRQRGLRVHLLDVVLGQGHRRGLDDLGGEQRLERLGHGEGHEAGAGTTRGAADEQRRAGVVQRARDHEQLAERALVAPRARAPGRGAPSRRRPAGRRRPAAPTQRRTPPGRPRRRPNPTGRRSATSVVPGRVRGGLQLSTIPRGARAAARGGRAACAPGRRAGRRCRAGRRTCRPPPGRRRRPRRRSPTRG